MDNKELHDTLDSMLSRFGAYEVAKVLAEVSEAASQEYMELGNDGAIIHADARELRLAVNAMRRSHPLRMMAD